MALVPFLDVLNALFKTVDLLVTVGKLKWVILAPFLRITPRGVNTGRKALRRVALVVFTGCGGVPFLFSGKLVKCFDVSLQG